MKKKLLLLTMLCASSSLCYAQKVMFEYDESGNIVRRYPSDAVVRESIGKYHYIKVIFAQDGRSANFKLLRNSGVVENCHIEVTIREVSNVSMSPLSFTTEKGDVNVSTSWMRKGAVYSIVVVATPNPNENPIRKQFKYERK